MIEMLAKQVQEVQSENHKIIIVTSGAVMYGMQVLNIDKRPKDIPLLQSTASVGQVHLMNKYCAIFNKSKIEIGQILLSADDFRIRNRYLNLRNTIETLLDRGVVPIINENDSVNTKELKFGDNDHLSSLITTMLNFDMLILLTDVDGFYTGDPKSDPSAKVIESIEISDTFHLENTNNKTSQYSSGGIKSKLESAFKVAGTSTNVFIGNGAKVSLKNIINKTEFGTYIQSSGSKSTAKKKWLAFSPVSEGIIEIDNGAFSALQKNSSLLAAGIVSASGNFSKGDLISIAYQKKTIARGLVNYSFTDINKIKGKKSSDFFSILSTESLYEEVIHKNNLYLLD